VWMSSLMAYRIRIDQNATQYIKSDIPPEVWAELKDALVNELAQDPQKHLTKPHVMLAIGGMLFERRVIRASTTYIFRVDVKYAADEETLLIPRIGVQVVPPPDALGDPLK